MTEKHSLELILHKEVQLLLDNFASAMHVHVVFFGHDGEVLRRGRCEGNCRFCQLVQERFSIAKCLKLDREKQEQARTTGRCQTYLCHAGLWEAIMPVMPGGELLGYVVFGQIRASDELPGKLLQAFPKTKRRELRQSFQALPFFSADSMENLTGLMKLLVDYIVRNELITLGGDYLYRAAVRYIEENLTRHISLPDAARHLGRSVSSLSHFLQREGTTFKKLLIEKRLAYAEKLLKTHPEMTIKETADRSGFSDAYYFSRIYRKYRARTPGEFRKKPECPDSFTKTRNEQKNNRESD